MRACSEEKQALPIGEKGRTGEISGRIRGEVIEQIQEIFGMRKPCVKKN